MTDAARAMVGGLGMPRSNRFGSAVAAGIALLLGLSLPAGAPTARAAVVTTTIGVTSTVLGACLNTASPLAFGAYAGLQLDGTGAVSVTCDSPTPYSVGLNAGEGAGALITDRSMTSGPNHLHYTLCSDPTRFRNWGNTVPTGAMRGIAAGVAQVMTIYGRVTATQDAPPGAFTDTIIATVTY